MGRHHTTNREHSSPRFAAQGSLRVGACWALGAALLAACSAAPDSAFEEQPRGQRSTNPALTADGTPISRIRTTDAEQPAAAEAATPDTEATTTVDGQAEPDVAADTTPGGGGGGGAARTEETQDTVDLVAAPATVDATPADSFDDDDDFDDEDEFEDEDELEDDDDFDDEDELEDDDDFDGEDDDDFEDEEEEDDDD